MTSMSYSRSAGHAILAGTWEAVKARRDIPDTSKLDPAERYTYDTASPSDKLKFIALSLQEQNQPPDFLRFSLATNKEPIENYPGQAASSTFIANGHLLGATAEMQIKALTGRVGSDGMVRLLSDPEWLGRELAKFHGPVTILLLLSSTKIYRTVGLIANEHGLLHGVITNKLLGDYWEAQAPGQYLDVNEWRAKTAVLAEWNGDYGHIEVTLKQDLYVLYGLVAQQKIDRGDGHVLPGGGSQYFIPEIKDNMLVEKMDRPIRQVIQETKYRGNTP